MVQIECTGIAPEKVFPETSDATESLLNYAGFWSIQPTGPAYMEETPAPHYVLEGLKDIQGIAVTYTYRLFRFDDSFAMVATGVPGGTPTRDVLHFLDSIEIGFPPGADLNQIVRDGDIQDLEKALTQRQWQSEKQSLYGVGCSRRA